MGINYKPGILTSFQESTLCELFKEYQELQSFYLTGGTALAGFYLHHRYSDDLDLFTHGDFDVFNLEQVIRDYTSKKGMKIVTSKKATLFYQVFIQQTEEIQPLKIDFVKDTAVHFEELEHWNHVPLDNLRNIASNKITAILGRTEVKDFADFYFLFAEKKIPLLEIFEEAKEKDGGLNEFYFAGQLRNVQNFKRLPRMLVHLDLETLKAFCLQISDEFLLRIKPK